MLTNFSFDLLINYDKKLHRNSKHSFKIYQGHHGDVNSINSNLIFPSTSFIEKNSFFSNLMCIVQKTKKVLFNPGNSRDDWKIINSLIEVFGFSSFKVASSFELLSFISTNTPFILYKRDTTKVFFQNFFSKTYVPYLNFLSTFNNFYLNDSITKNSKIMSLCSIKFKSKSYNFF